MLKLFDFLKHFNIDLSIHKCKIHLAKRAASAKEGSAENEPLNEFLKGKFEKWQNEQNKCNFNRDLIVTLINLEGNLWLFAGIYTPGEATKEGKQITYDTRLIEGQDNVVGHIIIHYHKVSRQAYRDAETICDDLIVEEYHSKGYKLQHFPGYDSVRLSYEELQTVIEPPIESWRGALSSVKGIYVITDVSNGKHYVGGAYGENGIWGRWKEYVDKKHGDNQRLVELFNNDSHCYQHFQFSILEIADIKTPKPKLEAREIHWKEVLSTRKHGYNGN